jgi:DNA-binding transcriptional MerR regulator
MDDKKQPPTSGAEQPPLQGGENQGVEPNPEPPSGAERAYARQWHPPAPSPDPESMREPAPEEKRQPPVADRAVPTIDLPEVIPPDATELTRGQVAKMLGCSIYKVRMMEERGELQPRKAPNGTRLFALVEIKTIAATRASTTHDDPEYPPLSARARAADTRTDGEIAAEVFRLFEERKTLVEIVKETGVVPKKVRELFGEYCVSLEDGERKRRAKERSADAERAQDREERRWDKHDKRMEKMERDIKAQQVRDEKEARVRRAERQTRGTPAPAAPPSGDEERPRSVVEDLASRAAAFIDKFTKT